MAKLKSGNVIVRLLLSHGEKLGILAILVCAGMLVWSAMGLERLDDNREPSDLKQITNQASQNIQSSTWDEVDPNNKIIATTEASNAMADVNPDHFPPLRGSLDPSPLKPTMKRMDPPLFPVEDLEVNGEGGLWASANPDVIERNIRAAMIEEEEKRKEQQELDDREGGRRGFDEGFGEGRRPRGRDRGRAVEGRRGRDEDDQKPRRRDGPVVVTSNARSQLQGFEDILAESWVTVVGKVPVKQQYDAYDEALAEATGYLPERDVPNYLGYFVERAEVTAAGTGEWKSIAKVKEISLLKKTEKYPPLGTPPLVGDRYTHPLLTHPLPPLILRDWDRRVTHSSIPTVLEEADALEDEWDSVDDQGPDSAEEGDDFFSARDPRELPGEGRPGGGRLFGEGAERRIPGARMPTRRGPSRGAREMYGGDGEEGGLPMGRPGMRGLGRGGLGRGSLGVFVWDYETSHILFRYFDNTVKPGGRYRYRVRLALADVNHDMPEQCLDTTVISRCKQENNKSFRLTEWSEPSPIASVPLPARVNVASVDAPRESVIDSEPEAKMIVRVFDQRLPAELALRDDFQRGSVLNPLEKATVIWLQSSRSQDSDEDEKLSEEFLFKTGITVLDMRGGQQLSRKNKSLLRPARVLMMDASGRLFVGDELDDIQATREFTAAEEGGADGRGFRGGFEGGRGGRSPYERGGGF